MIELLLQAERALTSGMLDQAERLYGQAIEADPRSSIPIVGLARVALERKDDLAAYEFSRRALAVDPDNVAAQRLVTRMGEVLRLRGELPAEVASPRVPSLVAPAARAAAVPGGTAATGRSGQSDANAPGTTATGRAALLRRLTGRR